MLNLEKDMLSLAFTTHYVRNKLKLQYGLYSQEYDHRLLFDQRIVGVSMYVSRVTINEFNSKFHAQLANDCTKC